MSENKSPTSSFEDANEEVMKQYQALSAAESYKVLSCIMYEEKGDEVLRDLFLDEALDKESRLNKALISGEDQENAKKAGVRLAIMAYESVFCSYKSRGAKLFSQ